jgi:hypothetical protein
MGLVAVETDSRLSNERMVTEDIDPDAGPHLSVSVASLLFFDRGPQWMRTHEERGHLVLDGVPVVGHRRVRRGGDDRYYTFYDIEHIAYALANGGYIESATLFQVALTIRDLCVLHGLPVEYEGIWPRQNPKRRRGG